MVEKIKTNVGGLLYSFDNESNVQMDFAKIELFSLFKPKLVYLRQF